MTTTLQTPQGQFNLNRYPLRKKEILRAWDAADEFVLNYIAETINPPEVKNTLILNDSFGALTTALAGFHPTVMSDSILSLRGIKENLDSNPISSDAITMLNSTEKPDKPLDLVVIKIPKSLAQLESQLHLLRPLLHADSVVIAAGMVKAIHTSTLQLFGRTIGSTRTSLAQKKARLVFSEYKEGLDSGVDPYPDAYELENTAYKVYSHAGVFSQQSLDIGTRFLLEQIPSYNENKSIIDLGCGNGVLGLMAAHKNPDADITFIDESYLAIESARLTFQAAFTGQRCAVFQVADSLENIEKGSVDCILNNPPFHQHNATGDAVAWQMFSDSHEALKQGGELWVVGNRHLEYHTKLKRLFGNYVNIASNKKFVVLKAIKR